MPFFRLYLPDSLKGPLETWFGLEFLDLFGLYIFLESVGQF
jgi:hypothetical protein